MCMSGQMDRWTNGQVDKWTGEGAMHRHHSGSVPRGLRAVRSCPIQCAKQCASRNPSGGKGLRPIPHTREPTTTPGIPPNADMRI